MNAVASNALHIRSPSRDRSSGEPSKVELWTGRIMSGLGIVLLACTALYAMPRTSLLGAILLTGYLGGAMAIHLRTGSPWFTHVFFGGYVGLAMWIGLVLRSPRVRTVLSGRWSANDDR